jgi:hypothetical protein
VAHDLLATVAQPLTDVETGAAQLAADHRRQDTAEPDRPAVRAAMAAFAQLVEQRRGVLVTAGARVKRAAGIT